MRGVTMDVPSPEPRVAVEYATIDPALLPPMTPATREAIDRIRSGQRSLADDATAMRAEIARIKDDATKAAILQRARFDALTYQIGVLSRRTRLLRAAVIGMLVGAGIASVVQVIA